MNKQVQVGVLGLMVALAGSTTQGDVETRMSALEARVQELETQGSGVPLNAAWQDGLHFRSTDGSVQLRLAGRMQLDFAGFDADSRVTEDVGDFDSGTRFRRGRLALGGSLHEHTIFNVEYELAAGDVRFLTTFVGVRNVPLLGTIRVGRFLEFYSLEQLSGNIFHGFMERGLSAAFNEYWANGIGIHNAVWDGRATWAVGATKRTNALGASGSNSHHNVSARITTAPVYTDDGRTWVHLGAATIRRKPDDNEYSVASRPESIIAPVMVSTGPVPSDRVDLVGVEFAATHGPATLQVEWHNARVSLRETEDFAYDGSANLGGFYVYAGYFLTGEHRTYNRNTGTFGRTRPRHNFRAGGHGLGAWEVAVRYSELDLDDDPVDGGHLRNATVGLNWYLNPNTRFMANYVRADLKNSGNADILQMRAQFDF